ncbi:hypothetical protein KRP22_006789 [Phytophthora ramorum]|nr:hypothetical protein KRP22_2080 [Phytophthora ramorum]
MRRLVLVMAMGWWLVAVTASSSSENEDVSDSASENWDHGTVDVGGDSPTSAFQPADDFIPKSNATSRAKETDPSSGNGDGLSTSTVGVIVGVSVAAAVLAAGLVAFAWRASRREDEGMFVDLGDYRSYAYGRFGDYAAM